eukprot:6173783-Pleurochrysis_carterae.AAC.2
MYLSQDEPTPNGSAAFLGRRQSCCALHTLQLKLKPSNEERARAQPSALWRGTKRRIIEIRSATKRETKSGPNRTKCATVQRRAPKSSTNGARGARMNEREQSSA